IGVEVRRIPAHPDEESLGRLEARVVELERKHEARSERHRRLEVLTTAATTLGVRLRRVPERPSDPWLDSLEARLRQVAADKGVPVPAPLQSPIEALAAAITAFTTAPAAAPAVPSHDVDQRIRAMLERAEDAGLRLGRIPSEPGPEW